MSREEAELEAQLVAQARTVIAKLLEQKAGRRDLSMTEMENLVGELEVDLRQTVMQTLVEESQAQGQGLCPTCGGKLRHKGKRRKQVVTVRGEVVVERDYYVCSGCEAGYFPPG
jgi:YgiT-type zinc finger domain-containing protein